MKWCCLIEKWPIKNGLERLPKMTFDTYGQTGEMILYQALGKFAPVERVALHR